ncbi:WAT1-related protein At5g64700-like isoform X1 [Triticum dicoccoides]|uniref:WAT1-related protein At5g64700-like isoform X1 n=1 Tax=Triticum dicoccoides TaxID=85692 RepID=UPI00188EDC1E|nr:WAT1-related protein At5g64700-like isoform X1 [Triticum dicoccoides]XP_044453090.1 WAT1-related protein At5g64700-like isoform X1 [Triticum aestivum]
MGNGKVYSTIVLIRLIYAGMHIFTKAAFEEGTSTTVFVFYRHAVAAIFLAPFAFFLEIRQGSAPPLTFRLSVKIFAHAFYGYASTITTTSRSLKLQFVAYGLFLCHSLRMAGTINLYSIGLNYASATSSSAIFNIVPVVAFILAVMFKMETLKLKSVHGMAKASGILLCIGGVVALALYQGPQLKSLNHHPLLHSTGTAVHARLEKNWALGIFLMTASVVIWALWTVQQGPLLLEYPSKLLNTTLQCTFASVQSFVIALVMERDFSRWKLAGGMSLFAVLFTGIVVAAISYYLQIWVIEKKGPVFLSMSMPLSLVFTMVIASFLLGEDVGLGSIIGGALLVAGLYAVLWGKGREERGAAVDAALPQRRTEESKESEIVPDATAKV